jgi:outer membrane protein TolC
LTRHSAALAVTALTFVGASACATGPQYTKPDITPPPAYKEAGNWKPAQPADQLLRGQWWQLFQDAPLNALEDQVSVSNETLKSAEAQFQQARALVRSARASYVPQVTLVPSTTASDQSANRPLRNPSAATRFNDYVLPVDVSYEADVWGRVRHTVDASVAGAQASAADLETVSLSLHAELAVDYFALRAVDAERQLLEATLQGYERALELTRNRFRGGLASGLDVAQAETQLETAARSGSAGTALRSSGAPA